VYTYDIPVVDCAVVGTAVVGGTAKKKQKKTMMNTYVYY
jgi:hypothetical protein